MSASTSPCSLPVGGLLPFSPTDWPGHLVATVFTQGCPLNCSYCHNPQLRPIGGPARGFQEVLDLLRQRRGLLDGAVISGGEPLMHRDLGAAIAAIHDLGFAVGLHTSGYAPQRLAHLLENPATRPDWVGLDIKGLPADAQEVCRCSPAAAAGCWECLGMLLDAGIDIQVRTTIWPGSRLERSLPALQEKVAGFGVQLVVQTARGVDAEGRFVGAAG